jgi:hypothetical protein
LTAETPIPIGSAGNAQNTQFEDYRGTDLTYAWVATTGGAAEEFRVRVTDLDENVVCEEHNCLRKSACPLSLAAGQW